MFSGVVSGISSIRVCDEVCFLCFGLDVVEAICFCPYLEKKPQTTQTRQRVALARFTRELLPQPLGRCCEDYSLNLFLSKCFQLATPKRLRQQLASETSESDGREPQARVGSTYLLRLCDALPCLRGLCFFPNKDRSKSLQPRLRKFQKSS